MIVGDRKTEILLNLDQKYGKDLLDPEKCKLIYQNLLKTKKTILSKLNVDNDEHPIGKLVKSSRKTEEKIREVSERSEIIIETITEDLNNINEIREKFQEHFDKLNNLQTTKQYIKVLQKMEYFNVELEKEYKNEDCEKCVTIFANLCEISWNLTKVKKSYLNKILNDMLVYWYDILKNKLSKDFDDVLKIIKWPFVSTNFTFQPPNTNVIEKLKLLTEYLIQIELPKEIEDENILTPIIDVLHLSLPVILLIEPLKKRFMYHFQGTRQTNRIDKPEWYFTQILTWIRDHQEFLRNYIQPAVDKLGYYNIDAEGEFTVGLVQLAIDKLQGDIHKVQFDDYTFSHTVDEALSFDKELRDSYNYPTNQNGILGVLTQGTVFIKWISMEKKFAIEKMDNILSLSNSHPFSPITSNDENLKITICADGFMTLLKRITERYESLPQPGHRLQFLELQLELLDDFRVRLIQIANAEEGNVIESKVPMIANTLYYMENVLIDWGNMLHYLNLYYYKIQLENAKLATTSNDQIQFSSESVFTDVLSLYCHMRQDLLSTLTESVLNEIKSRSKNYRRELWSTMKINKDFKTLSLTPSACPMYEIISKRLYQLQKSLTENLFSTVWKSIAKQLDTFLFEDLILDNKFNDYGAYQLKYDVERNLFPLFAQYTEKPIYYFNQLIESINLLNLTQGTAMLLNESLIKLDGATGVEDTRNKMLKEIGVNNFTPIMAVTILNHRTDMKTDKLIID